MTPSLFVSLVTGRFGSIYRFVDRFTAGPTAGPHLLPRLLPLASLCLANPVPVAVVQAQTGTTLVSNAGQTPVDPDSANIHAQLFTTGSHAGGYRFTTVDVYLATTGMDDVEVSIYSNNQHDEPGSSLYALTAPGTLTSGGFNTFTAPSGATLSPSTAYHVYVNSGDWWVGTVASTSEDDGIIGWSLADSWQWVTEPNDPWNDVSGALLVKITNTSAVPPRRPDPDPDPVPTPTLPGASAVGLGMLLYGLARRALSGR